MLIFKLAGPHLQLIASGGSSLDKRNAGTHTLLVSGIIRLEEVEESSLLVLYPVCKELVRSKSVGNLFNHEFAFAVTTHTVQIGLHSSS